MPQRALVVWSIVCALGAGSAVGARASGADLEVVAASGSTAAANDAASIQIERREQLPAPASSGAEAPASGAEALPAPPAASTVPAAREQRPLGRPNSVFSGRPASAEQAAAPVEESGGLRALDPRSNGVTRVIGSVLLVVLLAWGAARLMRRMSGVLTCRARPSGVIDVLARYPVARGQQLVLVKLGRRILLLHQNGSAMSTLSELVDEQEVAGMLARIEAGSRQPLAGRFQSLLERFNAEHSTAGGRVSDERLAVAAAAGGGGEIEVIDLTRGRGASPDGRGLLGRWRARGGSRA